jgi:hypothetical protein
MLQAGRSQDRNPVRLNNFFNLSTPAAPGRGVYSASGRNEYQRRKNNISGSRALPVSRADNLTAICEPIV